ncbi:methyltransferase RsmF C-terminal domain-like protein [Dysgonomonas massiliensis]|uniref:methyltransferase RsmF C-terminal domain-like protein n=1 Tax=Dysgonomonas massiliensis TaxID=2040292 RepID=UPI000C76B3D5|nr:rRNA cytosine-C5-methyltransferase [Dysgonomonas massiliensis]
MNLPSDFIDRMRPIIGDEWSNFEQALLSDSPVSIRLNCVKAKGFDIPLTDRVPWCDNAYYLAERPQFTFDPLFHAGCYYVQEASSMFVARALSQYLEEGVRVLDLCAAPGGKSTTVADLLDDDSLLVTNEVIRSRANILAENMAKWGRSNVVVTNNDPADFGKLNHFFDAILVDAPCSGEGMFRKDAGAINEWSVDNVKICTQRQQRIVADVWNSLKPGGLLIYSTCTYNLEEDEENVQWIQETLGAEVLSVDISADWQIQGALKYDNPVYRFMPHRTRGEGFFLAVLRKDEDDIRPLKPKKDKKQNRKLDLSKNYKSYIQNSEAYNFVAKGDSWSAYPKHLSEDMNLLTVELNVLSAGIFVGETKGKDFIPSQALALSNELNQSAFETLDIDWPTAIAYLRREPLQLPPEISKGYVLLIYKGVALGFVKNIGNRANNLYPQEWRIRSANIPESEVRVL